MDKIDLSITYLRCIKDIYSNNCVNHLEDIMKKISYELKELITEHKGNYDLVYKNSVHTSDLFKLNGRVKNPESLFDKFIRKDEGLMLLNKFQIRAEEDIVSRMADIVNYFYSYKDIIGVKILTELKEDAKNMYKLLLDHRNEISDKIIFRDIKNQPKSMKNGLEIYNIKGLYLDKYGFELQIKSKINSAWGDLDHSIFYKNYSFNPIKSATQLTMNHIGNMLDEIEKLLYSIRNAENNYDVTAKKSRFVEQLDNYLSEKIKIKFNSSYRVDKLADILFYAYENLVSEYDNINLTIADTEYYDLMQEEFENDLCISYKRFRENSFEAMILENIFLKLIFSNENINNDQYESKIKEYLKFMLLYLAKALGEDSVESLNERGIDLINILKDAFNYVNTIDLIIKKYNYEVLNLWIKQILDDYEMDKYRKNIMIKLWLITLNKGMLQEYLENQDINLIYELMEEVKNNINMIEDKSSIEIKLIETCNDEISSVITKIIGGN